MRLLLVATLMMVLPAAAAAERPIQSGKADYSVRADCPPPPGFQYVFEPGKPPKLQKLNELPPADSFAAVLRRDERGCIVPVKYREVRP